MRHSESRFREWTGSGPESGGPAVRLPAVALALISGLVLALAASPASAALRHSVSTHEFGPDGSSATEFGGGFRNIGFSQENHRVVVAMENLVHSITVNSPGSYTPVGGSFPFSVEIGGDGDMAVSGGSGATAGYIYTVRDGAVYKAWTPAGTEAGEFNAGGEICGLAVDNKGNVFAGNWNRTKVEEFPPGGASTPTTTFSTSGTGRTCKLTVDPVTDDVYTMTYSFGPIFKYSAADGYSEPREWFGNGDFRMDVNGEKHVLYLTDNSETIYAVDTLTGGIIEEIRPGGAYRGVAVDESNDTLYAFAYNTGRIQEIPLALVPKAITGEPVGNRKVSGIVAPDGAGDITECEFEWGTSANSYEKTPVPCEQATPITSEMTVTAELPEAEALVEQTYHYRVRAGTATPGGVNFGRDEAITPHRVPSLKTEAPSPITRTKATFHGSFDGNGEATEYKFEWGPAGEGFTSNSGFVSAGSPSGHTPLEFEATGLTAGRQYVVRVVAKNGTGESLGNVREFTTLPPVANLQTDLPTGVKPTSATLNGEFDIDALGGDTHWYFEYGETSSYGSVAPAGAPPGEDAGSSPGHSTVAETITISPGTVYHYRLVATNSLGTSVGQDVEFRSPQAPRVVSATSVNVTATTADLVAVINPEEAATTYQFEYGPTPAYGQVAPLAPASAGSGGSNQKVVEHLTNLVVGEAYHFRVVAENPYGRAASPDQTFQFFTTNCPNSHIRQETGAAYLPDCRAYELVSPGDTGGVQIFPGVGIGNGLFEGEVPTAPSQNTGLATSPSRFAFWAGFGQFPGTNAPNILQDQFVSTRTSNGWVTHFPGIPGNRAVWSGAMQCDIAMSKCTSIAPGGFLEINSIFEGSLAPYVYDANQNSKLIGRFPTMVESVPDGERFEGDRGKASGDFSHFAFSSTNVAFAAGGVVGSPGSAYDNNVGANSIQVISKLPGTLGGGNIQQDPEGCNEESGKQRHCDQEFIRVQALSTDGSHILMSNWAKPQSGEFHEADFSENPDSFPMQDVHLTMRVNDAVSYDVSKGYSVNFVGMTPDGSKVYFTSTEQVTPDDEDESVDLFMWSEATDTVTRISTGTEGTGNSDACVTGWTSKCGIQVANGPLVREGNLERSEGEIYYPDNWIADNGDIYFYSPELLDGGANGGAGKRNLYVYRDGGVHFVAKFASSGPATRMNVSPNDSHLAVLTTSQLTGYENAGHPEMYMIDPGVTDPSTGQPRITCASCNPTGEPPSGTVAAAENGRFMSNDGRTFFSTTEPLVPYDTDGLRDVYEYVDGRPQLISSGTAQQDTWGGGLLIYPPMTTGLEGVSSDGVDVYFSTFDTLTSQDHNGEFIKIYDARTGGGFPAEEPTPPCKAADECHGAGSTAPAPRQIGTSAELGSSGNAKPLKCKKGFVKKHGKCVRKGHKKNKKSNKRHHRSQGRRSHG